MRPILLAIAAGSLVHPGDVRAQTVLWEQAGPVGGSFGSALARAGDVNGDGVSEVVVGARTAGGSAGPSAFRGGAFLLSGASGGVLLQWTGPGPLALFGTTVAGPGDVDGDGTPDVAVGTLSFGAFVYSGANGALLLSISGGRAVGAPGDIDGDGHADVAVAVTTAPGTLAEAHVYSGADGSLLLNLNVSAGAHHFAGLGDLDSDGIGDLLVSTPQFCAFGRYCTIPQAFAYSCPSGVLLGEPVGAGPGGVWGGSFTFGETMAGLGDLTGDGVPDLAIGAPGATAGTYMLSSPGEVRVFSGADFSLLTLFAGAGDEALGRGLDGPGDVDGDGVPDLIVGAPGYGFVAGGFVEGRARVISGADASLLFEVDPPAGEALALGYAVAGIGDADSDGFPDFAVGSPGAPAQFSTSAGKVRAYSGAPPGVAPFGSGCAGSAGAIPRMGATRSPRIGTTFRVNLSDTIPSTLALLLLGLTDQHWWGTPLPLDLGFAGLPGCSLLVSPDFPVGFATGAFSGRGRAISEISLPSDASLAGASFFAQWYVVDPGPAAIPGAMTRALALTLQP